MITSWALFKHERHVRVLYNKYDLVGLDVSDCDCTGLELASVGMRWGYESRIRERNME